MTADSSLAVVRHPPTRGIGKPVLDLSAMLQIYGYPLLAVACLLEGETILALAGLSLTAIKGAARKTPVAGPCLLRAA